MCYPYPRSKTILQGRASFLQYLSYFLILLSFYIRYLLFLKYVYVCIWVCVDLSVWTFWWLVFWEQSEFGKMTLKPWKHIFFLFFLFLLLRLVMDLHSWRCAFSVLLCLEYWTLAEKNYAAKLIDLSTNTWISSLVRPLDCLLIHSYLSSFLVFITL